MHAARRALFAFRGEFRGQRHAFFLYPSWSQLSQPSRRSGRALSQRLHGIVVPTATETPSVKPGQHHAIARCCDSPFVVKYAALSSSNGSEQAFEPATAAGSGAGRLGCRPGAHRAAGLQAGSRAFCTGGCLAITVPAALPIGFALRRARSRAWLWHLPAVQEGQKAG